MKNSKATNFLFWPICTIAAAVLLGLSIGSVLPEVSDLAGFGSLADVYSPYVGGVGLAFLIGGGGGGIGLGIRFFYILSVGESIDLVRNDLAVLATLPIMYVSGLVLFSWYLLAYLRI